MPISNKEEMQIVKAWWKEYGVYLLFTAIIFLAANFGWRYWQRYHYANLESSSTIYMQMLNFLEQRKSAEFKLFGERLVKDYPRSPYASFAALLLAKEAVQGGDLKSAEEKLQFVIKKGPSKKIRALARIRAARVLIAMNKPKDALNLLSPIEDNDYEVYSSEVFGDALIALNQDGADVAYRKAEHLSKDRKPPLPLLKLKMQQF